MTSDTHREARIRRLLDRLADELIGRVLEADAAVEEGHVMTAGPPPYRRLDCDGRALAYIRSRPRRIAVRVDLSGLWRVPRQCSLQIPSAAGAALLIRSHGEIPEAAEFLREAVRATRDWALHAA